MTTWSRTGNTESGHPLAGIGGSLATRPLPYPGPSSVINPLIHYCVVRRIARDRVDLPLYLLGSVSLVLGVVHVAPDADPLLTELVEATILFFFGGATGVIGYRLRRRDATVDEALYVSVFVLAGGLIVEVFAVVFVSIRLLSGEPTPVQEFLLFIGWSVGGAAGAWTGYYFVGMRTSLTEQRELTKRLTVLQRVLRHNLRNEMTVIGGASRDLRTLVDDPEARAKVETIVRHADEVSGLSEQSGTLTRIWQADDDATVHLGDVLRAEIERFRTNHPDVPLAVDVPDEVNVSAHPSVGLAIAEAMENAVAHNEDVEVSLAAYEHDARSVTVEVADTGSGIPESELRPLWAPAEGPLSHTTGLGLWLIYWLVDASDADLDVRSDRGGTTLAMTFRRA